LVDPGVATIPITDNLVHPLEHPLLITSEGTGQLPRIRSIRETVRVIGQESKAHLPRTGGRAN
jgi:hypothetical protein